MNVVLITGTSSGMGQITARLLAEKGFRVFGGSLTPDRDEPIAGVEVLPLDVRDDASVQVCVAGVLQRAGRLDALVNNAGYALVGALEEFSLEEAKAQFETNFFGIVRMVAAVLPTMRRERRGHIVNISSGAGITAQPFAGIYTATKFATEGYTEALRHELRPFGIRVSVVAPGWCRTPIVKNAQLAARAIEDYGPWRARVIERVKEYCEKGTDPKRVAECVHRILTRPSPRLRYRVGPDVTSSFWLRRFLPESLFQWMVRDYYKLNSTP